jgi:protein phosphatase 1 regulatory subunit 7
LKRLKILSLQSNRITKLENLEELDSLEELYLSHNGVQRIEGLEHNVRPSPSFLLSFSSPTKPKLTTLDLGNNFIPELENISHLSHLQELWVGASILCYF